MRQAFLARFFPPSKTAKLRDQIIRFNQKDGESLYDAWERFKEMLRLCPHHGLGNDCWGFEPGKPTLGWKNGECITFKLSEKEVGLVCRHAIWLVSIEKPCIWMWLASKINLWLCGCSDSWCYRRYSRRNVSGHRFPQRFCVTHANGWRYLLVLLWSNFQCCICHLWIWWTKLRITVTCIMYHFWEFLLAS